MDAAAELELTTTERFVLQQLRVDGAPVGLIPRGTGCRTARVAEQLRERGLVVLWPGRGWCLTDAGLRLRVREDA